MSVDSVLEDSRDKTATVSEILLGDVGATNARFASLVAGHLGVVHTFEVARFGSFEELLTHVLAAHFFDRDFDSAVFALAGPIDNGRCILTNTSWLVDPSELKSSFGFDVQIINDFQAVAYSLSTLRPVDLKKIGGESAQYKAPKAALGPGSGLGVACLLSAEQGFIVVPSEGGHATLAGGSDREDSVLRAIRERFGHVSGERALSGPGLENIFQAVQCVDGLGPVHVDAAEISRRAISGECKVAHEASNDVLCVARLIRRQRGSYLRSPRGRLSRGWYLASYC